MIQKILAGMIFSAAVILGASEMPLPRRLSSKPLWRTAAAALLSAANGALLLILRKELKSGFAALTAELSENKKAAEEFFPSFLKGVIGGIHGAIISAAKFLDNIASAFTGFFESGTETSAFLITVLVISSVVSFLSAKYGKSRDGEDITGIWRSIAFLIKNEFADAFFAAPTGAVIIYPLMTLFSVPFGAVLCSLLWILSFIPFIGTPLAVITGTLILLLSVHPLKAIVFLLISSAVFALLNFREALAQLLKKTPNKPRSIDN